ncbi:MAG: alpha-hydroxy acid oxidase [Betaproteobacteria bacterium]|jgi:isopentenyl diphosphate isomerase/L-lactate dehydrogenase-like FMN-dependent dehydrogenase
MNYKTAYSIEDFRQIAKKRLPKGLFEFIDRGNDDEVAMRENIAALQNIKLVSRVLNDATVRNQSIELFGKKQLMPIAIGPTGSAGLTWFEGEIELAKAAAASGIPFTLATSSMTSMERVVKEAGGNLWFQLYMWPQRELSHQLVERANRAGFDALIFTVDTPVAPGREYNLRNGFTIPFKFTSQNIIDVASHPRWLFGVICKYLMDSGLPRYANFPEHMQSRITALPMGRSMATNESLHWDDVKKLRDLWPRKLIVKGIQHPEDAKLALQAGADAIIISNHGGRVLDSAPATIDILPEIVKAVKGQMSVLIDGGFRRGSDVVKALALGADAVLLGRATLYGTASGGQAGAQAVIELYRREIDRVLGLIGCRDVADLGLDHIFKKN